MIESVLIAFIIALFNKINVMPILSSLWMIPIYFCFIIYLIPYIFKICKKDDIIKQIEKYKILYQYTLLFIPFITLIAFAIKYDMHLRLLIGVSLFILGFTLNEIACNKNNNKMPGFPSLSYWIKLYSVDEDHQLGNKDTKVIPLTDIFDLGYNIFSIGDILMFSMYGIVIYGALIG